MQLSYWELKNWFTNVDYTIVGSGIVGLHAALRLRERFPNSKILVLERGMLPHGASTKNAGFACFGSVSELLDDLKKMPEETVWKTVEMRWKGLELLRKRLGDKAIAYKGLGGYELFDKEKNYTICSEKIEELNKKIKSTIGLKKCYSTISSKNFNFKNINGVILNNYKRVQ